jgi:Fe-S cluster assembly ATP-binding protein
VAYLSDSNLLELNATERSLAGLFLGFQYPQAIPGVTVANFLRAALKARYGEESTQLRDFRKTLMDKFKLFDIDNSFAPRYINDGFSGGEKKRLEILQMAMLEPRMAILDETDSGLDIDALKIVSNGINSSIHPNGGVLLVTHYQRMLDYVKPDKVHVMINGRLVQSGGPELALKLEKKGYDWLNGKQTQKAVV